MKKYISEFIGTMVLVLFGCGVAVVSGGNLVATALAFGLAIVACAYVIGGISGCHVNPAVSFACWLDRRLTTRDLCFYIIAQVLGALLGTAILYFILKSCVLGTGALGANGFGKFSNVELSMWGALLTEVVLTFVFIYTILGVTADKKKDAVAPIVIGLTLTFVHLLGINLTGTSVNPARSLAPAILLMGTAIKQVWVFIVGPFVGAFFAGLLYNGLNKRTRK